MKRMIVTALALVAFGAGVVSAANYQVKISADNTLSSCALAGNGSGVQQVHVFLTGDESATAVMFYLPIPSCWSGTTWLSDNLAEDWLFIGSSQEDLGLSIAFGVCRSLPLYLGHVDFAGVTSSTCCDLTLVHPSAWTNYATPTQAVDCNFDEFDGAGSKLIINPASSCPCGQQPLATEESTWGHVKALYR